jgi:hypothetical protein
MITVMSSRRVLTAEVANDSAGEVFRIAMPANDPLRAEITHAIATILNREERREECDNLRRSLDRTPMTSTREGTAVPNDMLSD